MTRKTEAPRPIRLDARFNRRRVLDAARQVFNEQGAGAEMREVARRAGVGLATVYRGFGSKDGLLAALAQQTLEELFSQLTVAEQESDPERGLRDFLSYAIDHVTENGPLFDILAGQHLGDPQSIHERFGAGLHGLLERGVAAGAFRSDLQVNVVEHLVFAALVTTAHSGALRPAMDGDQFAGALLELLH